MRSWKYFPTVLCHTNVSKRRVLSLLGGFVLLLLIYDNYILRGSWTRLDPPGVIVQKVGGLGNQLFIYACSYALAKHLGVPLYIKVPSANILHPQADIFYKPGSRPYVLDKFGVSYNALVEGWYTSSWPWRSYPDAYLRDRDLYEYYSDKKTVPRDKLIIVDDYCQSELFFKNYTKEIQEMYQLHLTPQELDRPPFRHWIDLITEAGEASVGVHIRRGDYGRPAEAPGEVNYWATPTSFYHTGITLMLEKLRSRLSTPSSNVSFFVFSDDIALVKEELLKGINLPPNVTIHFVSCPGCTTSLEEFFLMTLTRHMITGNSTFSWWAAWLIRNPGKIIIAPAFHPKTLGDYGGNKEEEKFKRFELDIFYPEGWIVINPFNVDNGTRI